jgi:hypothetical protein
MTERVKDRAELEREILEEMKDDYLGLWEIVRLVSTELGYEDDLAASETTLQIIQDMLIEGLIRPGVATADGGFEPWPTDSPGRWAMTISEEWARRREAPTVGDVAWFDLTDWGESVASTS